MVRYMIDSYSVDKDLGEVSGMVMYKDSRNAESSLQPFKIESLDGNVIHTQLVASALKFDADNAAAIAAAALPDTIEGVEEGVIVEFDDDGTTGNGVITGIVFEDADNDGIRNDVARMVGVDVDLLMAVDNEVVASTTTNANGVYEFTGVENGSYKVQFHLAEDYEFSPQNKGSDDTLDSDANSSTGITASFVLSPDGNVANIDCGMHPAPAVRTVQGSLFDDWSRDGMWDSPGESTFGVSTTVQLRAYLTEVLVDSVTTTDGTFTFHPSWDGDFYLAVLPPTDYEVSPYGGDNDFDNVTHKTSAFPISSGQTVTKDCGLMHELGYVDAHVFIDDGIGGGTANDGIQNGSELDALAGGVFLRVTHPLGGFNDAYPHPATGNIHLQVRSGSGLTAAWHFVDGFASGYHITGGTNPQTINVSANGTTDLGDRGVAAD